MIAFIFAAQTSLHLWRAITLGICSRLFRTRILVDLSLVDADGVYRIRTRDVSGDRSFVMITRSST